MSTSPELLKITHDLGWTVGELVSEPGRHLGEARSGPGFGSSGDPVVVDLSRHPGRADDWIPLVSHGLKEAHQFGRDVTLVRCSEQVYRCLRQSGVRGLLRHSPSVYAATRGALGSPSRTIELHLRSEPASLSRLADVLQSVARGEGLDEALTERLQRGLQAAAANAVTHGSPEGSRNHVRVTLHVDPDHVIIDVLDSGRGFDHGDRSTRGGPVSGGSGIAAMELCSDAVDFFSDDGGMLVRLSFKRVRVERQ